MNEQMPIYNFLLSHVEKDNVSFHMPGHKGAILYKQYGLEGFLNNFMDLDITEITGADNLFQPEGIIKKTQQLYAELYDVKKSYLLVNGSSGGIIAAILASVTKGKKMIMARNCHKSVFNALTLGDIQPIYVYPEMDDNYGISGEISPEEIEQLLINNPDAEAVILPSPNYYGICSDIEAIAKIVHKHEKILIVDQAHGAHLKFFSKFGIQGFPESAEEAGADIVINSTHKTLASYTQSAVLNLNSERVSSELIEDKLQCVESTSPSYLLMASLDINAWILKYHGCELIKRWHENLQWFYDNVKDIPGIELIEKHSGMDWTKMNFGLGNLGIAGDELERKLLNYHIFIELYTGDLVMCMSGIGNTRHDMKRLVEALRNISAEIKTPGKSQAKSKTLLPAIFKKREVYDIPIKKKRVPLMETEGMICGSSIIPYPPGIPIVCPGEKLDRDILCYVQSLRSNHEKVIGLNEEGEILVGI